MKTTRMLLALAVAGLLTASFVKAEEAKKDEGKAKCCLKAEAKGEKCSHECCVAIKDGKNCEKCGGKNEPAAKK